MNPFTVTHTKKEKINRISFIRLGSFPFFLNVKGGLNIFMSLPIS